MARPAKHNWEELHLEYSQGSYKSVAEFARDKDLHPVAVRREFKKIEEIEQNETKKQNKTKHNQRSKQNKIKPKKKIGAPYGNRNSVGHGAPKGNKNAVGHGAPKGNSNAVKHGFFRKMFPNDEETRELLDEIIEKHPLDILWENIMIQYLAIARAQKIMFVQDKDEIVEHLKREKSQAYSSEKEYELQFAWDRHANFLQAQARAMQSLEKLISKYEDLVEKYDKKGLVVEEHRLKLEKLRVEIRKIESPSSVNGEGWADLAAEGDDDESERY